MGCPSLPRPPTDNSVSTRRPGHSGILGLEGSQDGHPVGPGMGGGLGQCHRANWKQYRELSSGPDPEPCALPVPHCLGARPRDPPVFQVPVFPSVTAVVIHSRTRGQTTLSQPGAFEPSPPETRTPLFLLCPLASSWWPGLSSCRAGLSSSSPLLRRGVGCSGEPACVVSVCRAMSCHVSHWGLGACGVPEDRVGWVCSNVLPASWNQTRSWSECVLLLTSHLS